MHRSLSLNHIHSVNRMLDVDISGQKFRFVKVHPLHTRDVEFGVVVVSVEVGNGFMPFWLYFSVDYFYRVLKSLILVHSLVM